MPASAGCMSICSRCLTGRPQFEAQRFGAQRFEAQRFEAQRFEAQLDGSRVW
jgi:hypothetical protein